VLSAKTALAPLAGFCTLACGSGELGRADADALRLEQPVISGTDDRREVYEVDSAPLRARVHDSVGALLWSHRVRYVGADSVALRGSSLAERLNLCEGERFAEQPSFAFCSAVLIDTDLVLTAGHCMGQTRSEAEDRCQRMTAVFGYELSGEGELAPPTASAVYACRRVVSYEKAELEQDLLDLAIFQLDRGVDDERQPAPLAPSQPEVGDTLTLAATGAGLPLKVEEGAEVTRVPDGAGYFVAATDSFVGGSGGALFSTSLELVGHQVRGAVDWTFDGDCLRAQHAERSEEEHQLVARSLAALCAGAWPTALCGLGPTCGDGLCSGDETRQSCGEDCPAPRCGDGLCEVSERMSCTPDCNAFADVPASWVDDPKGYSVAPRPLTQKSAGCSLSKSRTSSGLAWLLGLGLVAARRRRGARTGARRSGTASCLPPRAFRVRSG
jgi:hypothetical protein